MIDCVEGVLYIHEAFKLLCRKQYCFPCFKKIAFAGLTATATYLFRSHYHEGEHKGKILHFCRCPTGTNTNGLVFTMLQRQHAVWTRINQEYMLEIARSIDNEPFSYSKKVSGSNDISLHFVEFSNLHNADRSSNATQSNFVYKTVQK